MESTLINEYQSSIIFSNDISSPELTQNPSFFGRLGSGEIRNRFRILFLGTIFLFPGLEVVYTVVSREMGVFVLLSGKVELADTVS